MKAAYDTIILISIDDLRFDCLGCEEDKRFLAQYGVDSLVNTPVLDNYAKKGIRFSQCVSTSSYTPAPHASMVTGQYPHTHSVHTFFDLLPSTIRTLPEILAHTGWNTCAWTEHLTFTMQNITKGIHTVTEPLSDDQADIFTFLQELNPHEPNFVFIHLFDVHKPYYYTTGGRERSSFNENYLEKMRRVCEDCDCDFESTLTRARKEARTAIKNFDNLSASLKEYGVYRSLDYLLRNHLRGTDTFFNTLISLYVEGVNKCDQGKLKVLLETLEDNQLMDNGILCILSDHGETRCTWDGREDFMNSFNVSEGAIHVPCILYAHDLPSGKEIDAPVSIIDIVPTIMEYCSITHDVNLDGCSMAPLIESSAPPVEDRTLFSETWSYKGSSTFFGESTSSHEAEKLLVEACARTPVFKYVWRDSHSGTDGFYNYSEDFLENHPLPMNEKAERLKKELLNYMLPYHIKKMDMTRLLGHTE